MNHSPEHLHLPEVPYTARAAETTPEPHILSERALLLRRRRQKMLLSLKGHISTQLFGALEKKLSYENDSLAAVVATDTRAIEVHQRLNRTLRSEYFIQKPIDDTI